MLLPAFTGSATSTFVSERSADAATVVVAVALSLPVFGSVVAEATVAVLERTVPLATPASTFTTRVTSPPPTRTLAFEHETVPPAPTAGVVQLQPAAEDSETKVV